MNRILPSRSLLPLLLTALLALLFLPLTARAAVAPADVPPDLQAAIKAKVEAESKQYAGLCASIDQPANVGKFCASVLTLTATTAEVTYGPVLSEPEARVTFLKIDGRWTHPGGGPGEGSSTPIPADLRDAVTKYVEARGHSYAGLCAEIAQDGSNIGKYCAGVRDVTATSATVSFGPVASNAITTVAFRQVNGVWSATSTSTPAPRPPATGSGVQAYDDGAPLGPVAMGVAGLALAIALGSLSFRRSQSR
ncbi:hypothetical protein J0H33_04550 [bacterium]|nr:hypothetical protein [bacterium]